ARLRAPPAAGDADSFLPTEKGSAMGVVPDGRLDLIEFFEQRAPVWSPTPATFNLSLEQTTALSNAVTEARIRYNNAQQARTDSRGATLEQSAAIEALATLGGQLVNIIRAWAIQSGDPSIFAQAG